MNGSKNADVDRPMWFKELVDIDTKEKNQEKKSSSSGSYDSLMDLLKENLTCEMYDASLKLIDTPHIVLKVFLCLFFHL